MNILYNLLKENVELYNNFLDLEYKKYGAVLNSDINLLDDIVSQEQAYYLKMRVLEQKREKTLKDLGLSDKTLKEIIVLSDDEQKTQLNEIYDRLNILINDVKKINNLCKTLIEIRLHKVDKEMNKLGEKGKCLDQLF
ncbi:MAG: flagellar protein FlgN [Tissierellia bacterium]|nr:flagellar protein FlgN [Tissierellia bacterium]MDD4779339.1 flagellar protein FlgN [Tissierellia bacterium]